MSIMEDNQEIVRIGTINGWAFRIAIWFAPIFSLWLVAKVLTHDTEIAVLKMQIAMRGDNGKVSQSVKVGATDAEALAKEDSAKTWLTTKDVAERQEVTEHTVTNWIADGMIEPIPVRNGKDWEIAANFRIVPKDTENCGKIPNDPKPSPPDIP